MAKAGDAYRELVGTVMAALDPGSAVKTEQWITGPDGERDIDVEVRGTLNGVSRFILVECKDHARPVGIGFVDAFESKIRDVKPDQAIRIHFLGPADACASGSTGAGVPRPAN